MNHLRQRRPAARRGFTLIELLIVIAIIAILVGMVTAAVVQALKKGKQTRLRVEISQIGTSIEQFKQKFSSYPPSRLMLCENFNYYFVSNDATTGTYSSLLAQDSAAFIMKMFPSIDLNNWTTVGINWNGNKDPSTGADLIAPNKYETSPYVILQGDQVWVFALGGIPAWSSCSNPPLANTPPQCLGFSANPRNPAANTTDRIGPFHEFVSNRLVVTAIDDPNPTTNPLARANRHYSYLDVYGSADGFGNFISGQPYAYFSSYKVTNGYNRYYNAISNPSFLSDCQYLGLFPYADSQTRYLNPNSYQLISAGPNIAFGLGSVPIADSVSGNVSGFVPATVWTPATASSVFPDGSDGVDDQANFATSALGISQ